MKNITIILSRYYTNIFISYFLLISFGYIDFISGYELSFQFFYIIPISIISSNKKIGILHLLTFMVLAALTWFFADYLSGHRYESIFHYFWNTLSRLIIFSFIAIFFNSNIKKRIKISDLNIELTRKNRKINESINYAQSIQNAINPSFSKFQDYFPNSFMLFKPKDVLSGDFFWYHKMDNKIVFALVDCTGHGVPGSMLNIIGNILLNRIVKENQIQTPSEILLTLNSKIRELFNSGDNPIDDGMEITVAVFYPEQMQIVISQTTQNALIIKKHKKIIEIDFSYFTVGGLLSQIKQPEYYNQTIDIEPDDMLYLFSDGYIDQFGIKNAKLGSKRFYSLILNNFEKSTNEQYAIFDDFFRNWKQDMQQTDDVTIIGIKF